MSQIFGNKALYRQLRKTKSIDHSIVFCFSFKNKNPLVLVPPVDTKKQTLAATQLSQIVQLVKAQAPSITAQGRKASEFISAPTRNQSRNVVIHQNVTTVRMICPIKPAMSMTLYRNGNSVFIKRLRQKDKRQDFIQDKNQREVETRRLDSRIQVDLYSCCQTNMKNILKNQSNVSATINKISSLVGLEIAL